MEVGAYEQTSKHGTRMWHTDRQTDGHNWDTAEIKKTHTHTDMNVNVTNSRADGQTNERQTYRRTCMGTWTWQADGRTNVYWDRSVTDRQTDGYNWHTDKIKADNSNSSSSNNNNWMTWSPVVLHLLVFQSSKNPRVCFGQMGRGLTTQHLFRNAFVVSLSSILRKSLDLLPSSLSFINQFGWVSRSQTALFGT